MAAKEESVILKYLKKNPGTEALDISFGTDIDEAIVKEILQQLLSKQMVAAKTDERGISTWTISAPPKPAPVPKPVKVKEAAPVDDEPREARIASSSDDADVPAGGVSKGFVVVIALVFALVSAGLSYVLAGIQINSAKAAFDLQLKTAQDSLGMFRIESNKQIDGLRQEVHKLQAPAASEDKAASEKPAKKVAKKKKK